MTKEANCRRKMAKEAKCRKICVAGVVSKFCGGKFDPAPPKDV